MHSDTPIPQDPDTPSYIPATPLPRTAAVLSEWIASGHQIGAQVYVSRSGRVLGDFAVGEARPGVPMTTDTVMLWLSASKPFAAVALAQLRQKGRLDFAERVTRFIPEFGVNGKDAITLEHLLTHTAGLRFVETGWPAASWHDIIATLCEAAPEKDWPIGQKAGYSPFASWFILAEVVRRLDGRAYEHYVRDEIFLPLGMADSWLAMPPERYHAYGDRIGMMMNTQKKPPEPAGDDTEQAAAACRPSGGGRGPACELGRFYEAMNTLVRSDSLPRYAGGGSEFVLSPELAQLLVSRRRIGMFDHTFRHVMDWGLGFILNSSRHGEATVPYGYGPRSSPAAFGHGGAQSTCAFADPERDLVVVIIFNGQPGEPAHQRRLRATLAALEEDLASV